MNCPNCNGDDTAVFFIEQIPCAHCDEMTEVTYYGCNNCQLMWKAVGDEIINNSFDAATQIDGFFDDAVMKEIDAFLKEADNLFGEEVSVTQLNVGDQVTMQGMIHKCLRCNAVSYETSPQHYHCPDCGFEWEVL